MQNPKRVMIARAACIGAIVALAFPTVANARNDALRRPLLLAAGALAGETFMTTCGAVNALAEGWQAGSFDSARAAELAESYRQSAELTLALIEKAKHSTEQKRMLDAGNALVGQAKALEIWIDQNNDPTRDQYWRFVTRADRAVLALTGRPLLSLDPDEARPFNFDIVRATTESGQDAPLGQFTVFQAGRDKPLGVRWKFQDCTLEMGIGIAVPGTKFVGISFGRNRSLLHVYRKDAEGLNGGYIADRAGGTASRVTYSRTGVDGEYLAKDGDRLVVASRGDGFADLIWRRPDGSEIIRAIAIAEGDVIAAVMTSPDDRIGVGLYELGQDGKGKGRWLTSDGRSGTEELVLRNATETAQAAPVMSAADLAVEVRRFAVLLREDLGNVRRFRPTDAQIDAIAATAKDAELLRAYVELVYSQIPGSGSAAKPGQTDIITGGPALRDLPGGYSQQIGHFREGVQIYSFKYVEPGKTSGMAYDGLIRLDGNWVFIPKAWRAFASTGQ